MGLSNELISQFAKLVNEEKKTDNGTVVYGKVVVDANGQRYVQLDGSTELTPVTDEDDSSKMSSTANVSDGERVSVLIKNHTATITGNISSPAAKNSDVVEVKQAQILLADRIQVQEGYIKDLQADIADIGELRAATAKIGELEADNVVINETLEAQKAEITDLKVKKIDASVVEATYATIKNLEVESAKVRDLEADFGEFEEVVVEDFKATNAEITNLKAKDAEIEGLVADKASVGQLNATNAEITNLKAKDAEIEDLVAGKATIGELQAVDAKFNNLNATYANIDFSNIKMAAVEELFAKSGIIKNLVVGDTSITGELVGVTLKGDLIEAGTLKADKLVVKGSDGVFYKLNVEAGGISASEAPTDSLHGSVITAKSITAEKVNVKDLVAFGATIGGFKLTENSIHSVTKPDVNSNTRGVYLDNEGQVAFGDGTQYLKYYKQSDGTYKLSIVANEVYIGTKNVKTSIEETKSDVDAVKSRVTNAETSINQNKQAIELRATKEEVTEQLSDRDPIGTASSNAIRIDDVSSVEHTLKVKAKIENLLDLNKGLAISGENIIPDGDNLILLNFGKWNYGISWIMDHLEIGKTYTCSVESVSHHASSWGWRISYQDGTFGTTTNPHLTFTVDKPINRVNLYIAFGDLETTQDITVVKPQLREGNEVLPFVPYVDLLTASVQRYGKNLIPYPYVSSTRTIHGITFTYNEDGTVTVNGTATDTAVCYLIEPGMCENLIALRGKTCALSGAPEGSNYNTYYLEYTFIDANGKTQYVNTTGSGRITTLPNDFEQFRYIYIKVQKGVTVDNKVFKPQLELNDVTEYERYKLYTTHNINENGAIDGITSWSPTTTLIPSSEGIVLNVEYNKNNASGDQQGLLQQTQTSLSNLSVRADGITAEVEQLTKIQNDSANSFDDRLKVVEEKASVSMTEAQVNIAIEKTISENGAPKLQTKTGYSFDDDGMTVQNSRNPEMKTQITEDGMEVSKNENPLLTANSEGVNAVNLRASTYLIIGDNCRFQDHDGRTACFWIGN